MDYIIASGYSLFYMKLFGLFLLSYFLVAITTPQFIEFFLAVGKNGQPIRSFGPKTHIGKKSGTATMGGIIILLAALISYAFVMTESFFLFPLLTLILLNMILGGLDDYFKVKHNNSDGISAKVKIICQIAIAYVSVTLLKESYGTYFDTVVYLPFFSYAYDMNIYHTLFSVLIIIGASNSVNLTDGLDGLVTVPVILCLIFFLLVILNIDSTFLYNVFSYPILRDLPLLAYFIVSLCGALLAFLWFNTNPAKIFMGDIGSLTIGAVLGFMAVLLKVELLFAVVAGLFVIEAMSVILQVIVYKNTRQRLFKMAPIHHHFELLGWSENKVVIRFWIISIMFFIFGLIFTFF